MVKKLTALCMTAMICTALLCGCGAGKNKDLPDESWPLIRQYEKAYNAQDDQQIYDLGKQLIAMMEAQPESDTKTEFLAGKYDQMVRVTDRLGKYDETLEYIDKYLPYGEAMGWTSGVLYAERKRRAVTPMLELYSERTDVQNPYYGAKFEPRSGAYFGSVYDNDKRIQNYNPDTIQQYYPKPNSVYLMYLEFGLDIEQSPRHMKYLEQARDAGVGVLMAWNTYTTMSDIMEHADYIKRNIDYLASTGLPIFLRFANEMNIGPNGDDPESYVEAFRFVADYAHTKENIAVVWSPNDVSALDKPLDNFYPGDSYVDWVGVSCYIIKYFAGVKDHGEETDPLSTYFYTGVYANPVVRLREINEWMDERGIQKPLMITEGGVPHRINTENEDCTGWAGPQMCRYYGELVRAFPRLKSICYFNVHMEDEVNDYSLYRSPPMNALYNEVTSPDYYLSQFGGDAGYSYQPYTGGLIDRPVELSAVAYYPKEVELSVVYYLNEDEIFRGAPSPYCFTLDPERYDEGDFSLTVKVFKADGTEVLQKSVPVTIRHAQQ